jgi:hypothetical protein
LKNGFVLALVTLVAGAITLIALSFGVIWAALSLRGIDSSWWLEINGASTAWPEPLPRLIGDFGPIGDLVGGILNPLVALCAFMALFLSLKVQREGVEQQLNQENFFVLLENRELAISNLELLVEGQKYTGRSALREIVKYVSVQANSYEPERRLRGVSPWLGRKGESVRRVSDLRKRVELFALLYQGNVFNIQDMVEAEALIDFQEKFGVDSLEELFGHIFRSTYQVLKFAHGCKSFSRTKKLDLVNYLRAQMSESEFLVFGLSALTVVGKKSRAASISFDLFEDRLRATHSWTRAMRYFFNPAEVENSEFCKFHKYPLIVKPPRRTVTRAVRAVRTRPTKKVVRPIR